MKLGLLLPGLVRNYNHGKFLDVLRRNNPKHKIYVFICCWDYEGNVNNTKKNQHRDLEEKVSLDIERVKKLYKPTRIKTFSPEDLPFNVDEIYGTFYHQWFMVGKAFELMIEFQNETGIKMDYVIRSRLDNQYGDLKIRALNPNCILVPGNNIWGIGKYKMNDRFAIGNPEMMKVYCSLYQHLSNYRTNPQEYCDLDKVNSSEALLCLHLMYHKTKFKPQNMYNKISICRK